MASSTPPTPPAPPAPFQSVLCAVDLTAMSPHVMALAAEMAECYEAKLILLHVAETWDNRYDFVVPDIVERLQKNAVEKLQAELAHLGRSAVVPVEVVVTKGHAAAEIGAFIRERKPSLVVAGGYGKKGLAHLLGSVADKVLRVSPASVLVVRPPRHPNIQKIVCAVDFSACSRTALLRALDIARIEKLAAIDVLNVFEVPVGYLEAGMTYESAFTKVKSVHEQRLAEFLRPLAGHPVRCQPVVEEGAFAAAIAGYAERAGTDLLVIGAHGQSALTALLVGGVSTKVLNLAKVPVLAVRAPEHYETLWQALDKM